MRGIALAAISLAGSAVVHGQAITTSSLTGTVKDAAGSNLGGAPITVQHVPTGSTYTTSSRADGTFAVRGLRPGGPYVISTTVDSFAPYELREVYLDIDRGGDFTLTLQTEGVLTMEKFEVSSSSKDTLYDPTKMGSGSYMTAADISSLPSGDRSINSLARLDPRITYNRDPSDQAISVSGLSNRFNSIQVDGVSANDPFGLNANNTAARRNVIPLDSLEALSVNSAPYNSRNAGFVGAQINAITKSGTNEFHGSLYTTYRGNSKFGFDMVGEDLDGTTYSLPSFKEKTYGATLGGPIIANKLFFYLSYEKVDEDKVPPSPIAAVDAPTVTRIVTALTTLGFAPGSANPPDANKLNDETLLAKLDWEINSDHRASLRYSKTESAEPIFPGFGTGSSQNNFSFDSYWYSQNISNESIIGQLISRWSDRLNTELSVSHSEYYSEPINNTRQPYVLVRSVPVPGSSNTAFIAAGTERSRHANLLEVNTDTVELFSAYELTDNHTLQAGFQYDTADIYNLFVQDALGHYEFNNLAELEAVAANNNGTVQYRYYGYNQIVPGVNAAAEFSEANMGIFLNDQWRVNSNLTLDLGARIDMPSLPDDVPFNQKFFDTFGVRNDNTYDGTSILQPRIGFNWNLGLEKRTIVRGGIGLFYGRAPRVWISNSYSNTGSNFVSFGAGSSNGGLLAPIVSANPDSQATTASVPPAQQVAFISPDFELPSRWKANIAIERELGLWDMKGTVEYEKTVVNKDVFYRNINIAKGGTGPDGRDLYFNTYGATAAGTKLVNSGFTNRIIELENTDKGGTDTVTISIERPQTKDGWYWRAAFIYNNASEVLFGTSSVASSNWQNRSVFNTNEQEEHRSELEVKNKITANITKDFQFVKGSPTSFSLFYEGRKGYPFSLVYNRDANGDGLTTNDLIYVPTVGDASVRYNTPEDQVKLDAIIDRFGLTRGAAVSSGDETYPWVNTFDFGVKQTVKLPGWKHNLVLGLDILNIGNLLNSKWGIIRGSNQFFRKFETVSDVSYDGVNNQYVISNVSSNLADGNKFNPSLGRGEPAATRWSALLSARYEF